MKLKSWNLKSGMTAAIHQFDKGLQASIEWLMKGWGPQL
jgi:hypothetical protein